VLNINYPSPQNINTLEYYGLATIWMKNKRYHTGGTVPKLKSKNHRKRQNQYP
jgi:hypothetical protein